MKKSFKTEVFLTIPLTLLAFVLTCASLITQQWVSGRAIIDGNQEFEITYNYGLFHGEKVRTRSGQKSYTLKTVCSEGYCFLSCGQTKEGRKSDLANLMSISPCDNKIGTDSYFCDDQVDVNCTATTTANVTNFDASNGLMTFGPYVSTIFFMSLGLLFTIVSAIFSFFNVAHTPIELIFGSHGLVAWNAIASFSYFLAMAIWGGEFNQTLSKHAPISDLARPHDDTLQWKLNGEESLGYSYWIIFVSFAVHALNAGIISWYIYSKYKPRQTNKEVGIDKDDKAKGTAMMF